MMLSDYDQLSLEELIDQSIVKKNKLTEEQILEIVRAVNSKFYTYDRKNTENSKIISYKFIMQHFRRTFYDHILGLLYHMKKKGELLKALYELNICVKEKDKFYLQNYLGEDTLDKEAIDNLYRLLGYDGPQKTIKLIGNHRSKWTFKKWTRIEDFTEYEYKDGGVFFRNILFRPGDVIPSNINLAGNGVYTALSEPRNYAYHLGVFCIIEYKGKKYPSVIETYELGVRAIPLSEFLSPHFNSYCEVYRHKEINESLYDKVNQSAIKMCVETKGYNFDTEDLDREYLSCTTVFTYLCELVGVAPVEAISLLDDPDIKKNRDIVGYSFDKMLALIDFIVSDKLDFVGAIDNNDFVNNITREVIERGVRKLYKFEKKDPKKLPLMFHLNLWGVKQVRKNKLLGKLLGLVFGFNHITLPKGDDRTLAIIEIIIGQMEKAEKAAAKKIRPLVKFNQAWNMEKFKDDTVVAMIEREALKPLKKLFR